MNRELVTKWVEALESGDFKQGYGSFYDELRDGSGESTGEYGYCCLGVADFVCFNKQREPEEKAEYDPTENDDDEWKMDDLGLTKELQEKLVKMNDGYQDERKRTFKYIAKYIRKNILGENVRVR